MVKHKRLSDYILIVAIDSEKMPKNGKCHRNQFL